MSGILFYLTSYFDTVFYNLTASWRHSHHISLLRFCNPSQLLSYQVNTNCFAFLNVFCGLFISSFFLSLPFIELNERGVRVV